MRSRWGPAGYCGGTLAEDVVTVREAADRLGVSTQRVRQLISRGALSGRRASGGWLIDADCVASRSPAAGRPVSSRTAWAVLRLLSSALEHVPSGPPASDREDEAEAIGRVPATGPAPLDAAAAIADRRLRFHALRLLSGMPSPPDGADRWRALAASRGASARMWAHPGIIERLIDDPLVSGGGAEAAPAAGESLSHTSKRDLYINEGHYEDLVARYRLRPDIEGQIIVHVVPADVPHDLAPRPGQAVPAAAAAADLLEEDDPRARRAALLVLSAMHRAFLDLQPAKSPSPIAPTTDHALLEST
jgi:excisionase family DNA binding protein